MSERHELGPGLARRKPRISEYQWIDSLLTDSRLFHEACYIGEPGSRQSANVMWAEERIAAEPHLKKYNVRRFICFRAKCWMLREGMK
jgi:hypothetical protein